MKYFELLDQAEIETIHENALRLLKEVGVIFNYDPAVEILKKAGCRVDGQKVFFETALVEELRTLPPSEFILYGRRAENNVVFNQNALVMIPCYGSPFVHDLDKGRRKGLREDFINFTKLTQQSPHIHMASTVPCEMTDIPMKIQKAEYIRTTLLYCDKPMVVSKDARTMRYAFETIKQVSPQGEFITHPHTLTHYSSLYNPRFFDRNSYQQWEEDGSNDIAVSANREWKKRVGSYV